MRVYLYHRTSAADAGMPPGTAIEALRRHAAARGWEIAAELVDHHPRHDGPRSELERLGQMVAELDGPAAVVVESLHRPFRDLRHMAAVLEHWLQHGAALVALQEGLDGTSPSGRLVLQDCSRLMATLEHDRRSEATRVGMIAARLHEAGDRFAPRLLVNRLEVKALYEEGTGGRYLSQRAMVDEIRRRGGRISEGTLRSVLREMREAGMLDHKQRDTMRQQVGAAANGRRAARLTFDPQEIELLMRRGCGARRIRKLATSIPRRSSTWYVRRVISAVRERAAAAGRKIPLATPPTPARERAEPKAGEGGGGLRFSAGRPPAPAAAGADGRLEELADQAPLLSRESTAAASTAEDACDNIVARDRT